MPRSRRRTLVAVAVPFGVVALLLAAWAIDAGGAGGRVARNVQLQGRDIGRLKEDRLTLVVHQLSLAFASTPIEIRTTGHTYRTTAGEAGLKVDEPRTVKDALAVGTSGSLPLRPVEWVASFASPREAPVHYKVRADQLALVLIAMEGTASRMPVEPTIVGTPDTVGIKGGTSGYAMDATLVGRALVAAAEAGRRPLSISTEAVERKPSISDDAARQLAADLTAKTAKPLLVSAGKASTEVPSAVLRSWLKSDATGGKLTVAIDEAKVITDLKAMLSGATGGEAKNASITLVDGTPRITPSTDATTCCAPATANRVLEAVEAGVDHVEVPLIVEHPAFTTADAEKLGIKEPVGTTTEWQGKAQVKSFTTYYPCCAARVTNIHKMADIVRGTLVKPGETFSINDVVGQRTTAKGFVPAGAIAYGEHVDEVGGGVSQFATTMFNAAFFAGLPFGEYQAHSEHFDRYPFGREATMGFPHPDLQWKNNTPYGILVWTSYTATSVTVQLWSTQYAWGEQTGQSQSHSGNCTSVTTQRTIHYADGHTGTDTVRARYRDRGATKC